MRYWGALHFRYWFPHKRRIIHTVRRRICRSLSNSAALMSHCWTELCVRLCSLQLLWCQIQFGYDNMVKEKKNKHKFLDPNEWTLHWASAAKVTNITTMPPEFCIFVLALNIIKTIRLFSTKLFSNKDGGQTDLNFSLVFTITTRVHNITLVYTCVNTIWLTSK